MFVGVVVGVDGAVLGAARRLVEPIGKCPGIYLHMICDATDAAEGQFPLASSRFGRDSIQYRVGKTHCQGHQDPSKSVSIFLRETEANVKMVSISSVSIPR